MAKTSVSQLAKDSNLLSAKIMQVLDELGVKAENAASQLDDDAVEAVKSYIKEAGAELKTLRLPTSLNVRDLAALIETTPQEIQKKLMKSGQLVGLTQALKPELIESLMKDVGYTPSYNVPEKKAAVVSTKITKQSKKKAAPGTQERPPIVTILGHVDHGKTSLLDYIRKAAVADKEFGGITQHIGAYQAEVNGKRITFLDTPGHEAFTKMRARGAQITDVAVLVVAADDGVMPQTVEALNHAKNAGVEIIVAINKMDKPDADPMKVQQMLSEHELVPREWGGTTEMVPVSAKEGTGVDSLLETILLTAEIMELKADPTSPLKGSVIEAKLDKFRGPVATVLVLDGTLKVGDALTVGSTYGKVKAMSDYKGERIKSAGPATPVEILGLSAVPNPGDPLELFKDEKSARNAASQINSDEREELYQTGPQKVTLANLFQSMEKGKKELLVILKGDVGGSVEAVREQLAPMENEEVQMRVISSGVGNIGEADIDFAAASGAIVLGFNVKAEPTATQLAERKGVRVLSFTIIYELLDAIERAMKGMLEPKYEEVHLGTATVRMVLKLSKAGGIAGSYVEEGKMVRNSNARLSREGEVIYTGKISSLKRFKDDVREVAAAFECGIGLDGFDTYKENDSIEAYEIRQIII